MRRNSRGAGGALRVGGVGAFRGGVVQRVVAPVEPVPLSDRGHAFLLLLAVGRQGGQVTRRLLLRGSAFLDRGDVVDRQQMHGVQAGSSELAQVPHPVALPVGERQVGPPVRGGNGFVVDREVAHMQLIDRGVLRLGQRRLGEPVPAGRLQRPVVEVGQHRALGVGGQGDRVRVGHPVHHHSSGGGRVDRDLEQVAGVAPAGQPSNAPHPVGVPPHRDPPLRRGTGRVQQQRDALRGGSPHRQRRPAPTPGRAEAALLRPAVDVVQDAGQLDSGRGHQPAVRVERRDGDLTGQDRLNTAPHTGRHSKHLIGGQVRELPSHRGRQPRGDQLQREPKTHR